MIVKNLEDVSIPIILNAFLKAFEGYFVQFPTDQAYFEARWKLSKVRFDLSFGVFDDNELVGFVLHGIDFRAGRLEAFNTGTGVIPDYRGQGLVHKMYDHFLPILRAHGINHLSLEVITDNEKAIHIYKQIGFDITKFYKCYKGQLSADFYHPIHLLKEDIDDIDFNQLPNQNDYPWDHHSNSLVLGGHDFYWVVKEDVKIGFFTVDISSGSIGQLDLINDKEDNWSCLFSGIYQIVQQIKLNNIDDICIDKIKHIENIGLNNIINQYEMSMTI